MFLALILVAGIGNVHAEENLNTAIFLEEVPEKVFAGGTITIRGILVVEDTGEGLSKVHITLRNENDLTGGNIIATGFTNDDGRFSINWHVDSKGEDLFGVYANYMGGSLYSDSQSEKYTIKVERLRLVVQTNKKAYDNGDDLIIFGKGRPNDDLSVFVTTSSDVTLLGTKITINETGQFEANLLTWGESHYKESSTLFM